MSILLRLTRSRWWSDGLWLNWLLPLDSSSIALPLNLFSYCPSSYLSSLVLSTMLLGATKKRSHSQGPGITKSQTQKRNNGWASTGLFHTPGLYSGPISFALLPDLLPRSVGTEATWHWTQKQENSQCVPVVRRPRDSLWTQTWPNSSPELEQWACRKSGTKWQLSIPSEDFDGNVT